MRKSRFDIHHAWDTDQYPYRRNNSRVAMRWSVRVALNSTVATT
jgi:hypothetical protein